MVSNLQPYRIASITDDVLVVERSDNTLVTGSCDEMLDFLVSGQPGVRVVWSLPVLVKAVESLLPTEAKLQFSVKTRNGYCATWEAGRYRNRIFFQPNKFFAVNRRKHSWYGDNEVTFFELDQFFPNEAEEE